MRRIVMFNRVTMDGFFASPDGRLDWAVPDPELDRSAAKQIGDKPKGAMIFGRRTYEMFASYWPTVVDDPGTAPDPHHPERRTPEILAMATWLNDADTVVFSRTLASATWRNSRLVRELDPQVVEAMKHDEGSDIMIFGSGSIVSQLAQHGLIDEYQFIVSPLFLGDGQRLLRDVSRLVPLTLLEATASRAGHVKLRYEPKRA